MPPTNGTYKVLGIMSGTSLDGLDIAYCEFTKKESWEFKIRAAKTYPYSKEWEKKLSDAIYFSKQKLTELDTEYGIYITERITDFIKENNATPEIVCSHGHTVLHQPEKGITLQIGSGKEIANRTNTTVVYDFRTKDVTLGGQGAPLVPVGDEHLFSEYDYCLNLGGFANVSYDENNQRKAYDICPVNMALNRLARSMGNMHDAGGRIASTGKVNKELLTKLNQLSFYKLSPPKSLGKEWYLGKFEPIVSDFPIPVADKLRTVTEHIVLQITGQLKQGKRILITGGGAYNTFLVQRIMDCYSGEIRLPEKEIIDFKEAMIFGFLGVLRYRNEINCLSSVTGASEDSSCGEVVFPNV